MTSQGAGSRTLALVRPVSASIAGCELTHLAREPIDLARAARQHDAYVAALRVLGCRVIRLPRMDEAPDATFVEDPVLVLDEVAVLMSPGADSRRGEVESVMAAVRPHRPIRSVEPPATIEGGDVLRIGRMLFIGRTSRTNEAGIEALTRIVTPLGYRVSAVDVSGCLHLKTACTAVGDRVLLNPGWVDGVAFRAYETLEVAPGEPFGANTLTVGGRTLVAASAPRTAERLEAAGRSTVAVDISELEKAEAGVSCLSVVFNVDLPNEEV